MLIFYKPEYADLAKKLRDNYRAHGHEEADIVSVEEAPSTVCFTQGERLTEEMGREVRAEEKSEDGAA